MGWSTCRRLTAEECPPFPGRVDAKKGPRRFTRRPLTKSPASFSIFGLNSTIDRIILCNVPRTAGSDGQRTRAAILREAADLATINGLDGLTIGTLADALKMSKSGLYAHFNSKEELQLATVDEAGRIFNEQVMIPASEATAGLDRIVALCDAFFDYLGRRCFPGGCFFAVTALEMGSRPGRVKDKVAEFQGALVDVLRQNATEAVRGNQIQGSVDPEMLAFELNGLLLAANVHFVLHGNDAALSTAKRAVRRCVGISDETRASQRAKKAKTP
jgi:AcrR family transcriptional regulator